MAGTVARLPSGPTNGDEDFPPIEIYKAAIEEYRFQAQFNWSRTQYLLAFNAAILAAAVGLGGSSGRGAVLVFALGAVVSVMCQFVIATQQDYYHAARDRMRRVEAAVGIPEDQRVDMTATLGGRKRLISVNQVVRLLLATVTVGNTVGAIVIFAR